MSRGETEDEVRTIDHIELFDTSSSEDTDTPSEDENEFFNELDAAIRTFSRKSKTFYHHNTFDHLNEEEFESRFRLPRQKVQELAAQLDDKLSYPDERNYPVTAYEQLLILLRYAIGSMQILLADNFRVSKATVCRVLSRTSRAIAELAAQWIVFPRTAEELNSMKAKFYAIAGIPKTVGVIDGTHIPIESPGGINAQLYRNRKGIVSINTQVVVDADMKIIDIVARWPDSNHDQGIFKFSAVKTRLESREFGDSVILGDSGYACKRYLLTPLANQETPAERRYQEAFIRTRLIVERTIGVWKRRFPVVGVKSRRKVENHVVDIVATAVLHNMLRDRAVPVSDVPVEIIPEDTDLQIAHSSEIVSIPMILLKDER